MMIAAPLRGLQTTVSQIPPKETIKLKKDPLHPEREAPPPPISPSLER